MKIKTLCFIILGFACQEVAAQSFASVKIQHSGTDSMAIRKLNQQNNEEVVVISPNPSNGNLQVKNIHRNARDIQLYVFDIDGVMIENIRLQAKETKKINGLVKGTYLYDVFVKDESIERGKIIVE